MSAHPIDPHIPQAPESAWVIQYADSNGTVQSTWANGVNGPVPTHTLGESAEYPFILRPSDNSDRGSLDAYNYEQRYQTLRTLSEHAGSYQTFETDSDRVLYTETTPANSPSVLIGLVPAYETSVSGVWGLLDSMTDDTTLPTTIAQVSLSLTVLAPLHDYDSRSAVVSDLEYSGLTL